MMPIEFRFDWLVVIVILALLGSLIFSIRQQEAKHSRPLGQKKTSVLLRIIVYCFLLWLILEPKTASVPSGSVQPSLSVLVDVSRSMGIDDREERLGMVKKILQRSEDFLEENFDLSYFQFSQNSSKTTLKELLKIKPYGSMTDISAAIEQVLREKKQDQPAILLFSDGSHNFSEKSLLKLNFDAPIYSVGVGNAEGINDIALKDLRVSDFAFKNRPVELAAKIQNFGFAAKTVPIYLKEKKEKTWNIIATQTLSFKDSASESELTFKFVPSAVGSLDYRIEVPVQEGEIAKQNNALDFHLEVGREKIRVLYLCGQPSPEYAFLRQILKSDPSIELVSFVILRNPENVVPVPEDQLSLIPFPAQDIFVKTLPEFDLLIFENFSYSRFGILPSHLDNIQRFVEDRGGGFLMIGGENSFGRGGYQGTGIERILPVLMNPASETVEDQTFSLRVLEPQQPIFDIGDSLNETQRLWRSMPQLNGYHKLPGIKIGATLLATIQENGLPAIVGWQRGKGRVLAMATLSTWQWALGLVERGSPQSYYIQFWRQTIRWLTTASDSKAVRIVLFDSQATVGKKIAVKLILQSDKLKSLQNSEVQLTVSNPGKAPSTLPLVSSGKFEYRAEWTPQAEGEFVIEAAVKNGAVKYEDRRTIPVTAGDLELENPYPDHSLLKEISEKSGGEYFDLKDFSPELLKGKIKRVKKFAGEQTAKILWTNPWLFSLLICLLIFEWGLRRYRGEI